MKRNSASVRRRNRQAALNRAARNVPCECPECRGETPSFPVPRPLVVAYQGPLALAVISGEFFEPFSPPVYAVCGVDESGAPSVLTLDFVSRQAAELKKILNCFVPEFSIGQLLAVCDLLPKDLSATDQSDVGCLDLALNVTSSLSVVQRAALVQSRKMIEAGVVPPEGKLF